MNISHSFASTKYCFVEPKVERLTNSLVSMEKNSWQFPMDFVRLGFYKLFPMNRKKLPRDFIIWTSHSHSRPIIDSISCSHTRLSVAVDRLWTSSLNFLAGHVVRFEGAPWRATFSPTTGRIFFLFTLIRLSSHGNLFRMMCNNK